MGARAQRFLLIIAMALIAKLPVFGAGELLEYSLIKSFERDELQAFFKLHKIPKVVLPVNYGINIYEVIYTTLYADSTEVKASGLVYVPIVKNKNMPLMIYNHGTEICRDRSCSFTGEQSICLAFATDEYIVMTPDYIGLGKGERNQLYLNAHCEARSTIHMLEATEKLLPLVGAAPGKHLFVTGYSQGGHAAMATTRMLQHDYADRYKVTASAPMSGPYDLEKTVHDGRNEKYDYPAFLLMMFQAYFEGKGEPNGLSNILVPPYDKLIPPLLDGNYPVEEVNKLLPDTVFKAFKPWFYKEFSDNPESDFRTYLRQQNVFDWKPEMPMMLCYCDNDEEVTYKNSITAYETMKRNGSKKVELWRAGKKFGHVNCALFAVIYTKMFFDGFRHNRPGYHGPAFKRLLLNIGKLSVPAK